jgi:site-specific DNA-methyltransferase (adenine-specific)
LYNGDTLNVDLNEVFGKHCFDIIIGIPPYNKEVKLYNVSLPLYNEFVVYYINKWDILSYIVPSRWFTGGKGLNKFRNMMINRTDIVYINHHIDASKIFGKLVDIKGGVNYFLIDKYYNGLCNYNGGLIKLNRYDIIIDNKYDNIIDKMHKFCKITTIYNSQEHYKIQSNDKRLKNIQNKNDIICYVSKQKGFIKYINKNEIKTQYNKWKVLTTSASHSEKSGFGNIFIGKIDEVHCKSYIGFNVNSESDALSLLSYMKCKLPNLLLSLRKLSHNLSADTCKWIPLPPLNKEWNDEEVYKYFKLTEDEIKLIKETKINGYKDIVSNIKAKISTKKIVKKKSKNKNKNRNNDIAINYNNNERT